MLRTLRQAVYWNVTLRRVRTTIVAVAKQKVLHVLSVCLWPYVSCMQCAGVILSSMTRVVVGDQGPEPRLRFLCSH
jgi:hypothetical protein